MDTTDIRMTLEELSEAEETKLDLLIFNNPAEWIHQIKRLNNIRVKKENEMLERFNAKYRSHFSNFPDFPDLSIRG